MAWVPGCVGDVASIRRPTDGLNAVRGSACHVETRQSRRHAVRSGRQRCRVKSDAETQESAQKQAAVQDLDEASQASPPVLRAGAGHFNPAEWQNMLRVLREKYPPELVAILLVYFVQGVLGISRLAVSFFLKDQLQLGPSTVSAIMGLSIVPWMIKPVYGFFTDSLPVFGYRRRSYLLIAGVLGAASWGTFGLLPGISASQASVLLVSASMSVAVADVVADSMVVERARSESSETAGTLQSLCWGSSAVGGLLSAYFSGSLLEVITPQQVFLLSAVLPMLAAGASLLIKEERVIPVTAASSESQSLPDMALRQAKMLWGAIQSPRVWKPTLFLFLWQATPSAESAMFFFQTSELHMGPEFLGRVRLVSSIASLMGVLLFQKFLSSAPIKNVLVGATLLSVPLGLTQLVLVTHYNRVLGIEDKLFALSDSAVLTVLAQVSFMPVLVLAARICPPGVEGTLFATLMSIYNAASVTGSELGALVTSAFHVTESNFENLPWLVTTCVFSSLIAIPFAGLLNETEDENRSEES
ncbi:Folate-biopterin transporter 1, chloroplastic [Porphyridium purpureum]|uniref:Folate-biopterin transporter 1, chloroplastic n=1 Tax=Porphyridium purpureum TaxID=35688 RepID=A0A5J4Z097_PORPP|nr:Folate-biopterin transporter 1, chloroplastic [Porphyridium purpureum]|eukprot:POR3412..scf209_3